MTTTTVAAVAPLMEKACDAALILLPGQGMVVVGKEVGVGVTVEVEGLDM